MERRVTINRQTKETQVSLSLDLDSAREPRIETNLPLLTHFVSALAVHGQLGLEILAQGDIEVDPHHLVEDVGITLGQALTAILGERRGIARYGQRLLPMDDALVLCAIDLSGRAGCYLSPGWPQQAIGQVQSEVWPEFFRGFSRAANATVHLRYLSGENAHHVYEACFKGFGIALKEALSLTNHAIPSTKGLL